MAEGKEVGLDGGVAGIDSSRVLVAPERLAARFVRRGCSLLCALLFAARLSVVVDGFGWIENGACFDFSRAPQYYYCSPPADPLIRVLGPLFIRGLACVCVSLLPTFPLLVASFAFFVHRLRLKRRNSSQSARRFIGRKRIEFLPRFFFC